jgi:endonuclease/exonuclease/phosphatase family metal-dependent hydrolase
MKHFTGIVIACIAALTAAIPASADTATAKQFLQLDASEDGRGLAEVKITAMEEGIRVANAHLAVTAGSRPLYCQPASLVLTASQLADMIGREVGGNRKLEDVPVPIVLLGVLQKTFPCEADAH